MKKIFVMMLTATVSASTCFAFTESVYCRYGESCYDIVSQDLREAQKICSREVFDKEVVEVRQQQQDGSVIFIGYSCVSPILN